MSCLPCPTTIVLRRGGCLPSLLYWYYLLLLYIDWLVHVQAGSTTVIVTYNRHFFRPARMLEAWKFWPPSSFVQEKKVTFYPLNTLLLTKTKRNYRLVFQIKPFPSRRSVSKNGFFRPIWTLCSQRLICANMMVLSKKKLILHRIWATSFSGPNISPLFLWNDDFLRSLFTFFTLLKLLGRNLGLKRGYRQKFSRDKRPFRWFVAARGGAEAGNRASFLVLRCALRVMHYCFYCLSIMDVVPLLFLFSFCHFLQYCIYKYAIKEQKK